MTRIDAVRLIVDRFPILKERVDQPEDIFESAYVTYGMLATEILENTDNGVLFNNVAAFVDELANSGDDLLEELLVIDVLEGIAQDPDLSIRLSDKVGLKAAAFLKSVEREYYGRTWR